MKENESGMREKGARRKKEKKDTKMLQETEIGLKE